MPTVASFRSRLVTREPLYGAWSVIPSPLSVRLLAAAGLDYVVIDLQHGGVLAAAEPPVLNRVLQRVWTTCAAAGKPVGVHATDGGTARRYRDAGCTLITIATDAVAITRETAAQLTRSRA